MALNTHTPAYRIRALQLINKHRMTLMNYFRTA